MRLEKVRCDTCAKNLFGTLEPCVYVHTHEKCADVRRQTVQQKNVRATGKCTYTSPSYTL